MSSHNDTGKRGEDLAADHLTALGYGILERNARIGHYELDIVAMKGGRIVFVEVKTRSDDFADPIAAIGRSKIRYLCRAANAYVTHRNIPHEVQFDVITIIADPDGEPRIEHYPDAFRPPLSGPRR